MQAVDRALLFVLTLLSMIAAAPLWTDTPGHTAAAVVAIVQAAP